MTPLQLSQPKWHRVVHSRIFPNIAHMTSPRSGAAASAAEAMAPGVVYITSPGKIGYVDVLLQPGPVVRISPFKGKFEKCYMPNWSVEDFRVVRAIDPVCGATGSRV